MSEQASQHIDELVLLAHTDGELSATEMADVDRHLLVCAECRSRVEQLRISIDEAVARHQLMKSAAPAPPRPWRDLQREFKQLDSQQRRIPARTWIGIAAGVVVAAVIFRLSTERTVSAAELLEKASNSPAASQSRGRIQVKTRRHTFLRPATLSTAVSRQAANGSGSEIKALFEEARFNWEDPLSARSFAQWREPLPQKNDQVTVIVPEGSQERYYRIRTTTSHGPLTEAALTIRAADMRPVHEVLQFGRVETVEITELAEDPGEPSPPASDSQLASEPGAAPISGPAQQAAAGPGEELRVLAALNRIGADLGEPVEVTRSKAGAVHVAGVGIDPERQREIRESVAGIPGVTVEFEQPQPLDARASPGASSPVAAPAKSPLHDLIEARIGSGISVERFIDQVLKDSEMALTRAHAIRNLAARFPRSVELSLAAADRRVLRDLIKRHFEVLSSLDDSLDQRLAPVIGAEAATQPTACGGWHDCAAAMLTGSQQVDQVLNVALAGTGREGSADPASLREALGRWRNEIAGFEAALGRDEQ